MRFGAAICQPPPAPASPSQFCRPPSTPAAAGFTSALQMLVALLPPGTAGAGLREGTMCAAAERGDEAAVRLLLEEAPETAAARDSKGTPSSGCAPGPHGCDAAAAPGSARDSGSSGSTG